MSEEECISILLNHCTECDLREYSSCNECENKFKKAVQGLLDLYQKQKEKNKELEEELQKYISGEYFTEKQAKHLEMTRKMFWINKDKIREILEEYKYTEIVDTMKIIEFYKSIQELLEEN